MKNETWQALTTAARDRHDDLAHSWLAGALSVHVSDEDAMKILETLTGKAN